MNTFAPKSWTRTAVAVGAICNTVPAQAQFRFPTAELHAAGSSMTANALRQSADCYGLKADLGVAVRPLPVPPPHAPEPGISLSDFDFNTPSTDTLGSRFNCAGNSASPAIATVPAGGSQFASPRIIQPDIRIWYLSAGSGEGITAFLNNRVSADRLISTGWADTDGAGSDGDGYNAFDGYQFSVLETPLSATNQLSYFTDFNINPFNRYGNGTVDPTTGAISNPIPDTAFSLFGYGTQVPFVVVPIAVAYSPVYAKARLADGNVINYRFTIAGARADGSGGLKLTRAQYCGIFNGTITNWNQLPTSVVNKDPTDPVPFNVPIGLVGQADFSGTTSLFTRALAAQCNNLSLPIGPGGTGPSTPIINKFGNAEARLPYDGTVTIPGTAYTGPASTISPTNSLSGAFVDILTGYATTGTPTVGGFTVSNGNGGVAAATAYLPEPGLITGDRTINGKIAYVSPEQTLPATLFNTINTYGLNTASLQQNGTGTTYLAPNSYNAGTAFAGNQPPQSKGTAGAYCTDASACPTAYGNRANALDWVQASDKLVPHAAPTKGYPIIGTSNLLFYTCYATANRRQAIVGYFATIYGKTLKDYNNQSIPPRIFTDPVNGVFAHNGLAPVPAAWANAITETFLKSSSQLGTAGDQATKLGLRNLWVQDRIPSTPTGTGSTTSANLTSCQGKPGA